MSKHICKDTINRRYLSEKVQTLSFFFIAGLISPGRVVNK